MSRVPAPVAALLGETMRSIGFLSRLPVGARHWRESEAVTVASDARAFPLAGMAIAAGPALLLIVLDTMGAPPLIAAAFATLVLVAVTGALHEDGLADVADGFGGGGDKERRLAIMKDSRIGTYGGIAVAGGLLLRVAGLAAVIAAHGALAAALSMIAVAAFSRAAMVWIWAREANARVAGVAHDAGAPSYRDADIAAMAGLAIFAFLAIVSTGLGNALAALVLGILILDAFVRLCRRMIGGQTGDTLGACQQIVEIMTLTGLALTISIPN